MGIDSAESDTLVERVLRRLRDHGVATVASYDPVTGVLDVQLQASPDTEEHRRHIQHLMLVEELAAGLDGLVIELRFT